MGVVIQETIFTVTTITLNFPMVSGGAFESPFGLYMQHPSLAVITLIYIDF